MVVINTNKFYNYDMTEAAVSTPLWRELMIPITLFVSSLFVALIIYVPQYLKVKELEKDIEKKHTELEELPKKLHGRTSGSLVTQSQLDRMIESESKPIKQEIERLERKRRFVLEKIPLLSKFVRL